MVAAGLLVPSAQAARPHSPVPREGVTFGPDGDRILPLRPRDVFEAMSWGVPWLKQAADEMRRAQELAVYEYSWAHPLRDLNGDGLDEVAIYLGRYTLDPVNGTRSEVRIQVVNGHDGSLIWKRRLEIPGSGAAVLIDTKDRRGRNGLWLLIGKFDSVLPVAVQGFTIDYEFRGLDNRGRDLWSYSTRTQYIYTLTTFSIIGMLTLDIFEGTGGRESDLLTSNGEYVDTAGVSFTEFRISVVDGRDGRAALHGVPLTSVNFIPWVGGVDDLDLDGKDDYVVMLSGPYLGTDDEDTPFLETDGIVSARAGDDGEVFWDTPIDLGREAWVDANENITSTRTKDLVISHFDYDIIYLDPLGLLGLIVNVVTEIHLIEGRYGERMWDRPGESAFVPGDIDRDGRNDVISLAVRAGDGNAGTLLRAYSSFGKLIYRKLHTYDFEVTDVFNFMWIWWANAGDVHPDAREDLFLRHEVGGGARSHGESLVVDSSRGDVQVRATLEVDPLAASLDNHGTDLWADCWRLPGTVDLMALGGTDKSVLWSRSMEFDLPVLRRGWWLWQQPARTSRAGNDLVVDIEALRSGWVGVLDGRSGEPLWLRQMYGLDHEIRFERLDEPSCEI